MKRPQAFHAPGWVTDVAFATVDIAGGTSAIGIARRGGSNGAVWGDAVYAAGGTTWSGGAEGNGGAPGSAGGSAEAGAGGNAGGARPSCVAGEEEKAHVELQEAAWTLAL